MILALHTHTFAWGVGHKYAMPCTLIHSSQFNFFVPYTSDEYQNFPLTPVFSSDFECWGIYNAKLYFILDRVGGRLNCCAFFHNICLIREIYFHFPFHRLNLRNWEDIILWQMLPIGRLSVYSCLVWVYPHLMTWWSKQLENVNASGTIRTLVLTLTTLSKPKKKFCL